MREPEEARQRTDRRNAGLETKEVTVKNQIRIDDVKELPGDCSAAVNPMAQPF